MSAIQRLLYGYPKPAPGKRTKPLEVLCLGLPRTGTESLSVALGTLGIRTYHGWDLVFEPDGAKLEHVAGLLRRKYNGDRDGDVQITPEEFDVHIGDYQAVIDSLPAFFSPELFAAYPDAKVILNVRPDIDAWYRSINKTIVEEVGQSWTIWFMHWFSAEFYWLLTLYMVYGYPKVFYGATTPEALQRNAKWVYRNHCNMVRGMVPKEQLLEWSVEDGWEPLCKFLDKPVPKEPFPRTNKPADFANRSEQIIKLRFMRCARNFTLTTVALGGITTAVVMWWQGRLPEATKLCDLLKRFTNLA